MSVAVWPPTYTFSWVPAVAVSRSARSCFTRSLVADASGAVSGTIWYTTAVAALASFGNGPTEKFTPGTVFSGCSTPSTLFTGASVVSAVLVRLGLVGRQPDGDEQRPVHPRSEALAREFERLPLRQVRRQRARVGHAEVDAQERRRENQEHDDAADKRQPWARGDVARANLPQKFWLGSPSFPALGPREPHGVDLVAGEAKQRGAAACSPPASSPQPRSRRRSPRVCASGIGTNKRPRSAMHTVAPTNIDALPAEPRARPTASSVERPSWMCCRNRVR